MWAELYDKFWDRLVRYCTRLCRDGSRAEDLAQEAFLKALQNTSLLEGLTTAQRKAWLFAAAHNAYCDQLRREEKEAALREQFFPAADADGDVPDETSDAALHGIEVSSILAELPEFDRTLLTLRYEAGYTATELGELYHMPPATIRTRLLKARNQLKKEFTEE